MHHVADDGIDCRYCHTSVETSSFAGIPPTKTCMNCHSVLFANAPFLEPVRASFRDNTPLHWVRVHDLPDFVYFNHSIHVKKGVGCETCHGRVDQMPLMYQQNSLLMEWCINCHTNPAQNYVRPRSEIYDDGLPAGRGRSRCSVRSSMKEYDVNPPHELLDVPSMSDAHMNERNDIEALRARLEATRGREYWRSLESLAETPEFKEFLHREFPQNASEWLDPVGRRGFLKLMGASLALAGVSACTRQPDEEIVPYVRQPEEDSPRQAALLRDRDAD